MAVPTNKILPHYIIFTTQQLFILHPKQCLINYNPKTLHQWLLLSSSSLVVSAPTPATTANSHVARTVASHLVEKLTDLWWFFSFRTALSHFVTPPRILDQIIDLLELPLARRI